MKIKLKHIRCAICESDNDYQILYKKNFKLSDLNVNTFSARRLPDKIHYQLVKCNQCELVRSTPIVEIKCLSQLYKKSLLSYDDEINNLTTTYNNSVKPILKKLPKNAKILEIGCGNGFILKAIYDLGYKNVFGIEPSTDANSKSNPKIKKNIITDILKPGLFNKESFDFIFFFQTFDHIPEPNKFLKECYHLLKKNGYILSFNHNIDSFSAKLLGEKSPIIDIEHIFLYSPKTIKAIFKKNGFIINKVYFPKNTLSIKHLFWLLPIPKKIKQKIIKSESELLDKKINIKIGNICIEGQKK
ncbi:MAG: methyltransferase type 11 [uncultured bacterium]|nr:MAG: methyltransferase type 11 [uncultured bacterium]